MYDFYENVYCGNGLEPDEFPEYWARAGEKLDYYCRRYRVSGDETMFSMARCAMADVMAYYDAARNGQGGLRYASVGTVSVSGKGIYSQVDVSPAAEERDLYRTAATYLDICRAVGG